MIRCRSIFRKKNLLKLMLILPIFILNCSYYSITISTYETNKSNNSSVELSATTYSDRPLGDVKIGCYSYSGTNPRTKYTNFVDHLIRRGATIEDISVQIDDSVLAQYSIIWFDIYGSGLTTNELNALTSWISNGGSVIITGYYFSSGSNGQQIMNSFSIDVYSYYISDYTSDITSHPITTGVSQIYLDYSGRYLDLSSQPAAISCVRYDGDTRIAALEYGSGRLVMIMDNLPNYASYEDNQLFLDNTFGWLSLNVQSYYYSEGGAATFDNNDVENNSYIGIVVVFIIIGITAVVSLKFIKKVEFKKARDNEPQELSDKEETIKKFTDYLNKMTWMNKALEEKFTNREISKEEYAQKKSIIVQKIREAKEKLAQLK